MKHLSNKLLRNQLHKHHTNPTRQPSWPLTQWLSTNTYIQIRAIDDWPLEIKTSYAHSLAKCIMDQLDRLNQFGINLNGDYHIGNSPCRYVDSLNAHCVNIINYV